MHVVSMHNAVTLISIRFKHRTLSISTLNYKPRGLAQGTCSQLHNILTAGLLYLLNLGHDITVLCHIEVVYLARISVEVVEQWRVVVVEAEVPATHFIWECIWTQAPKEVGVQLYN